MREVVIILGVVLATAFGLHAGLASKGKVFGALPDSPTPRYSDDTYPFTPDRLRARLERVRPHVEAVVGASIDLRDIGVDVRDPYAEADRILRSGHFDVADTTREEFAFLPFALAQVQVRSEFGSSLANYNTESKCVTVFPLVFEASRPPDAGALLDVVLAHELAHVWQDQTFGAFRNEGLESHEEAELARAAVIEGSAEFVARAAAKRMGIASTFEANAATRDVTHKSQAFMGTAAQRQLARWRRWAYGEGLRFVDAVHERLGPRDAWQRLFRETPTSVWSIEHPEAWIARASEPVATLDTWARRFCWLQRPLPTPFDTHTHLGSRVLLRDDLHDRLGRANLQSDSSPWSSCRGGVFVGASPKRGSLAHREYLMRVWRFTTPEYAIAAAESLDATFHRLGPRACLLQDDVEPIEAPRVLADERGARVYTSLAFFASDIHAREVTWGYRVHDSHLVEIECYREGAAPVMLELLEAAVASWVDADAIDQAMSNVAEDGPYRRLAAFRAANRADGASSLTDNLPACLYTDAIVHELGRRGGEPVTLDWLKRHPDEVSAWMCALGPAEREKGFQYIERPLVLDAALCHPDEHVVRHALSRLANRRVRPTPLSLPTVRRVAALCAHNDPWIRCVAVRAAEALAEYEPLDAKSITALASDKSPAVREALATSRKLLKAGPEDMLLHLSRDAHGAVARAAKTRNVDRRPLVERMVERAQRFANAEPSMEEPEADTPDVVTGFETLFAAVTGDSKDGNRAQLLQRLRRLCLSANENQRGFALLALPRLGEDERKPFLPDAVRALESPGLRSFAVGVLVEGDWNLAPVHDYLIAMLDDPRWRADVLFVLASQDLPMTPSLREHLTAWRDTESVRVRVAASLYEVRDVATRNAAMERLRAHWHELSFGDRNLALAVTQSTCPQHRVSRQIVRESLISPVNTNRIAAQDQCKASSSLVHVEALLDGLERTGPLVASELFYEFLTVVNEFDPEKQARAREMFVERLHGWCESASLPRISGNELSACRLYSMGHSQALADALDRCIRLDQPSVFQVACALLRSEFDADVYPEPPDIPHILKRILSMQDRTVSIPFLERSALVRALGKRVYVSSKAIRSVVTALSEGKPQYSPPSLNLFFMRNPQRIQDALSLVPGLLAAETSRTSEIALDILESARPLDERTKETLKPLVSHALPKWRTRLEKVLAR